jgi:hypothetical protein
MVSGVTLTQVGTFALICRCTLARGSLRDLRSSSHLPRASGTKAIAKLRTDMESRTRAIEEGLSGTARMLHESQTSGLWMAYVALVMLLVGTALSEFPELFYGLA